ncbi:MAG: FtsX-like permease family protein [Hyphomicrobiaceae bacterium]
MTTITEPHAVIEEHYQPSPRIATIALNELRGGLRGFYILIACIALGVAVITAVGGLSDALRKGFERQGAVLLGGDVALARAHRRAEPDERAWMTARGKVSETVTFRAMARRGDNTEDALVEIKGVDDAYPLVGDLKLRTGDAKGEPLGAGGAVVEEILLERLKVRVGDRIRIGRSEVEIRAVIVTEPDKITNRLSFGPRVMLSLPTLLETGLIGPGSLVRWRYALKLPQEPSAPALASMQSQVRKDWPNAGFQVLDRRDPAPRVTKTLERLRQFLTLIGLTSLLIGGVGVANAVTTYIERRRKVIATMRALGSTTRQILILHLTQVLLLAVLGILLGLAVGLSLPPLLMWSLGSVLPVQPELALGAETVFLAIAYGLIVTLLFSIWPLGRAEQIKPAVLFREEAGGERVRLRWPYLAGSAAMAATLLGLALWTSESQRIALSFCAAVAGIFLLFTGLGQLIAWVARRLPRPRRPELALAIAGLGAPGGLTRSVVLSLGSGLSLLAAVAAVDGSIVSELQGRLPKAAPNFFVLDIPNGELGRFNALVARERPGAHLNHAPMLRGRLVDLAGRPAESVKAPPQAQWVLNGDRGLTYAEDVPEGSRVVAGKWWERGYAGPPLVSFEAELARQLGLALGDSITVNVLGRNITARIANLREVEWESLAINFVMVFSPNTLKAAPHNMLATITLPLNTSLADEADLARTIGRIYPTVTAIRVKDAINSFNTIFEKVMVAVRAAGGVTLLAGALVLAGAFATSQRRRTKQAVILKALGGTRGRIVGSHLLEYALLAVVTSVVALAVGNLVGWAVLWRIMDVPYVFSWGPALQVLGLSLGLVLALGGIGTWRILSAPAVPYLKGE